MCFWNALIFPGKPWGNLSVIKSSSLCCPGRRDLGLYCMKHEALFNCWRREGVLEKGSIFKNNSSEQHSLSQLFFIVFNFFYVSHPTIWAIGRLVFCFASSHLRLLKSRSYWTGRMADLTLGPPVNKKSSRRSNWKNEKAHSDRGNPCPIRTVFPSWYVIESDWFDMVALY